MSSTRSATPDFGDSGDDDAPASLGRPPQPAPPRQPALAGRPPQPPQDYALEDDGIGRPYASEPLPMEEAPAPSPKSPRHHGLTHALSTAGHELVHGAESAVHFVVSAEHALEQGARRTMSLVRQVSRKIMNESLEDEASATKFHTKKPPRRRARALKEDQVPFPPPEKNRGGVWNPMARPSWDMLILGLIFVVMILAPFEITFLPEATGFTGGKRPRLERPQSGLFAVNLFVDFCFLMDILLALNTAYFDEEKGEWVVEHARIFWYYLRTWMVPDVVSVIPFAYFPTGELKIFKLAKLFRLLKLLRILKQPRIMSRLSKHCTIRAELMTVLKYVVIVAFQIHFGACLLRYIDGVLLMDNCVDKDGDQILKDMHKDTTIKQALRNVAMRYPGFRSDKPHTRHGDQGNIRDVDVFYCPPTVLGFYWKQGVAAQYSMAFAWTLGCMQGELSGECVAELWLNVAMTMSGCIVLSFLVGDLCNAVTNMDPVRNDFVLAFDSLNNYIEEVRPPPALRYKLREFMSMSEVVFREDYHRTLLERLSPGLLSVVAQHNLANIVVQLPFYVDTLKRAYQLKTGMRFIVNTPADPTAPRKDGESITKRWATLVYVHRKGLLLDVIYDDKLEGIDDEDDLEGGAPPMSEAVSPLGASKRGTRLTVPISWVQPESYGSRATQDRCSRALYEENRFVVALTCRLTTKLFMKRDTLIRNNLSVVSDMYVVQSGKAAVFGRHSVSLLTLGFREVNDVIGDDICTLVCGDKETRRRHYTARALSALQVYVLTADAFREVHETGMFDEFAVGMRRYGCYLRIQRAFIVHARARLRGDTHHLHWGRAYTFSDQHGSSENLNLQDEDDVEDEAVIAALRDVHEDIGRLLQAPASAQKHFADQNPELVALAPNFADLKRRVVNALGHHHRQAAHQRREVVSNLQREEQTRSRGFQAAF